ncbi:hypothetical protein PGQ11_014447 [Apiospora arundinis]|uniref:Uncharacterized protein n=1 Tax=Apiospora arundinis TaxID=335852 RepID=A0ABR2HSK3_9PEZI
MKQIGFWQRESVSTVIASVVIFIAISLNNRPSLLIPVLTDGRAPKDSRLYRGENALLVGVDDARSRFPEPAGLRWQVGQPTVYWIICQTRSG